MKSFWILIALAAQSAQALPLSDIPGLVDRRNEEVGAARKDVEAAGDGVTAAWARYLPAFHWRNSFIHLGSDIKLQLPTQSFLGATIDLPPVTLQKQDIFLSSLTASFPIFAGGRISAGTAGAKAQREESQATLRKTAQEKIREAVTRYFGAQVAKRVTVILEAMNTNLDRLRSISEAMVKTGLGTRFSVLQLRVAQSDLQSRLAEARGKVRVADMAFKTSVAIGGGEEVAYETLKKIALPASVEDLKKDALLKRSEFDILKAKSAQAEALREFHTGEMLPSLALVGTKQLTTTNLPVIQPAWAIGLLLDVPLTASIGGIAERQRVVKMEEKVEILRGRARQEVPLEVEKLYREAEAADAALAATDEGVDLAREALRLAEVRFKNGDGSSVELLRATTDLETAEIRSLRLLNDYNEKLLDLYRAAGDIGRFVEAYGDGKEGT